MPARQLARDACQKRGCILTCYVNGRKRFIGLTWADPATAGQFRDAGASEAGSSAAERRGLERL